METRMCVGCGDLFTIGEPSQTFCDDCNPYGEIETGCCGGYGDTDLEISGADVIGED